jgi:hypothetical protein
LRIGLIVAVAAAPAAAQLLYGGLVGTVTDANGAVVPAARVTIINTDTNLTRETTTDAQGAFSFANVLAGPYDVRVALEGFREVVRSRVPVTTGQISRVDLSLQVGALTESITVQSNAELLQTDKADVHTELKSTEITNLPLNRFRNYQGLVVLVPGSLPPAFQNAETDTPQRSLNMTVNGQDGAANTTLTDGTRNVNVGLPHHNVYIPPAETIESVNFTTGSMDAEEGMAAGVAITVITKSGTNTFKGSAFEFFNNEKLNASPFYFGRTASPKLPIERQTFGGTLGGPIRRNQVFFFGSYERGRAPPSGSRGSAGPARRRGPPPARWATRCRPWRAAAATRSSPAARAPRRACGCARRGRRRSRSGWRGTRGAPHRPSPRCAASSPPTSAPGRTSGS